MLREEYERMTQRSLVSMRMQKAHCGSKIDWLCLLLRTVEGAAAIKAHEFEEFQVAKDQEIENLQGELEGCKEEV
jgi:hypothetical protein